MEIGGHGNERGRPHGAGRYLVGDEGLIPVDLHVRADSHVMIRGRKFSSEIDDDHLVFPGREADVGNGHLPASRLVSHLE